MKSNKNITVILSLIIFIFLLIYFYFCVFTTSSDIIRIGAILPLTGNAANAGINTKMGIDLALQKINDAGGVDGKLIEIIYEDCQGQPSKGVSAIQKLINVDKVQSIIDNSLSNVTLAIAPIADTNRIIIISTGASSPKISSAGDYIFRIWNSDELEGEIVAKYASDSLKIKNYGTIYINNEYGIGLKNVFEKSVSDLDATIKFSDAFQPNSKDFRSLISKFMKKKLNTIYLVGYPEECSSIIRQLKELGFNGTILGTIVMADPIVQNALTQTKYVTYYPLPVSPDTTNKAFSIFLNDFRSKYNEDPPILAGEGYDALNILIKAISETSVYSGSTIKDYLYKMELFNGASGMIKFDLNGDVRKPIKIIKVN